MEVSQVMEAIVTRRKGLGITQEMLAKAADTDQCRVSQYERGEVEPGTAVMLRMLSAVRLNLVLQPLDEFDELG